MIMGQAGPILGVWSYCIFINCAKVEKIFTELKFLFFGGGNIHF